MPSLTVNGVDIAYDDIPPPGSPQRTVILLHGYASNRNEGWRRTGWYGAFERRGARVIGLDQRGHGESAKPRDPQAYARETIAADVLALADALGVQRFDLIGYSMGARTALQVALAAPERVSKLVLGGVGGRFFEPRVPAQAEALSEAMLADDPQAISNPLLRSFRHFADEQGDDRAALAAFARTQNPGFDRDTLAALPMPVLVVAGQRDNTAGDPEDLARAFPHGRGVTVIGCDHFSAIPHALTKAAVFDFLDGLLDDPFPEWS
ncbi:alpha/beta fold hydrolase [Phenylobacterium sp. VNQ135]|uniref:alpha/beta fold hydrolase n=1 Tax=Phenylobacterium sp. VNQ135 TaxID=3400922 RepID=UPI003C0715EF